MDGKALDARMWAEQEFSMASLGDERRTRRLVQVAAGLAERPTGTLPGAFEEWSELKGAYRLLSCPQVTHEGILSDHWERTRQRCGLGGEYLLAEDSTELDFKDHPGVKGLGRVSAEDGHALFVHTTLAMAVARWDEEEWPEVTVVGLFGQRYWVRGQTVHPQRESDHRRLNRKHRESQRWAAVFDRTGGPPWGVRWTYLADREGDIYEVFGQCRRHEADWIVRANHPRALAESGKSVLQKVAESPVLGRYKTFIRSRANRPARWAVLEVRVCRVTLRGPYRPGGRPEPITMNVVEAKEVDGPAQDSIHWVLLTSWPCESFAAARRVIHAYGRRWLIEEYHKALKTGTRMEETQLATAERIEALLGILALVAVRLLNTKLEAATHPDEPLDLAAVAPEAEVILTKKIGRPRAGWTNASALSAVARLGGFIGRKSDGRPGWLTIWRGWQRLMAMAEGYALAKEAQKCG